MHALRLTTVCGLLVLVWQAVVWLAETPHYILPGPARVGATWWHHAGLILSHAQTTVLEIVLGLILGTLLGVVSALVLTYVRPARLWLLPLLVASQAVPVFALAPILVLWLGYGIASKVAMATLIIYFPVAANFFDGLRRTEPGWLDLARAMGASPWRTLWRIRVPAALPALASGVRVAAAVAPHRRRGGRVGGLERRPRLPHAARQRAHADRPDVRRAAHPRGLRRGDLLHHRPRAAPGPSLATGHVSFQQGG